MRLAPWLFGNNPAGLGPYCGWHMRMVEKSSSIWGVQTTESVHGSPPQLIETNRLANVVAPQSHHHYSRVSRLGDFDSYQTSQFWQQVQDRDARVAESFRADRGKILGSARNLAMGAPTAATLQQVLPLIAEHRLLPLFPSASIWLTETNMQLAHRYGIVRSLLRTEEEPDALQSQTGTSFRSSQKLFSDTSIGLSAYLDPLFTSLSPDVWGISAPRAGGIIIYLFGELESGSSGTGNKLLDLFAPRGSVPVKTTAVESKTPPAAYSSALRWWTKRLNLVLAEATNLTNYVENDLFSAPMMVEKLINLEQVFRHSQSLATIVTDEHARRLILMTALEAFGGISNLLNWDRITKEPQVRKMLARIELEIPEEIQAVLLPRARRAVRALREVQDGFFVENRRVGDNILVRNNRGEVRPVPAHDAASLWLRVLRNSHHGFDKPTTRDRDLLVIHDGSFPRDLPDLTWLFVLYILCFPEVLHRGKTKPSKGEVFDS